ncbi:MAG: hypothetical protein RBR67_07275 [Desulfobacterium sp.]|nr:hypothetical protein [Desulfobacterium sp.]
MKEADRKIREIDRELAAAERRLERFKQATAEIQAKNRANLENMGLKSTLNLEEMMKVQGVHPQGMDMFRRAMAESDRPIPDFLEGIAASKTPGDRGQDLDSDSPPGEAVKKKKRVKIRL